METEKKRKITPEEKQEIETSVRVNIIDEERMGAYDLYHKFSAQEADDIKRDALEKAYNIRFSEDKFARLLLNTGNSILLYNSSDPFLGVGRDGKGYNYIGKLLTQIRTNLRRQEVQIEQEKKEQEEIDEVHDAYIAMFILRKEVKKDPELKDYNKSARINSVKKTYLQKKIIDAMKAYNEEKRNKKLSPKEEKEIKKDIVIRFEKSLPEKDFIYELYKKGKFPLLQEGNFELEYLIPQVQVEAKKKVRFYLRKVLNKLYLGKLSDIMLKRKNQILLPSTFHCLQAALQTG